MAWQHGETNLTKVILIISNNNIMKKGEHIRMHCCVYKDVCPYFENMIRYTVMERLTVCHQDIAMDGMEYKIYRIRYKTIRKSNTGGYLAREPTNIENARYELWRFND